MHEQGEDIQGEDIAWQWSNLETTQELFCLTAITNYLVSWGKGREIYRVI